ncbi:MAG: hypothetical protein AABW91_02610 [Nanoarchaeota archaeon]
MRVSRREFLGLTGLTGYALVSGCGDNRRNYISEPKYFIDKNRLADMEKRVSGVLMEVEDGMNRKEQKIARIMVKDDSGDKEYCLCVKQNGRRPDGHLFLDQLRETSIGDFVSFPTKDVDFNSQTGEYKVEDIFHGKDTYGVIKVDSLEMRYNPDKQKIQDEAVRKYNQKLNDLYDMRRAKK